MLFGYPISATEENWLHDCLLEILDLIHNRISNHQPPIDWPEIIPEPCRKKLRRKTGLKKRIEAYRVAASTLSDAELEGISNALHKQNEIAPLLKGSCDCKPLGELPESVRPMITEIFSFAFELLAKLGIRDRHYKKIYDSILSRICPFCGNERFDGPGAPREDLDHYLVRSKYPFASINLQNLVPMGKHCNSKYKLIQDVLYSGDTTRRKSYFPYDTALPGIKISLEESDPFGNTGGLIPLPLWDIHLYPELDETTTWEEIFHIKERYQRDILDPGYIKWLRHFSSWCSTRGLPKSEQELLDRIEQYVEHLEVINFEDQSFLKAAVFRMIHKQCKDGNERLMDIMKGLVAGGATV